MDDSSSFVTVSEYHLYIGSRSLASRQYPDRGFRMAKWTRVPVSADSVRSFFQFLLRAFQRVIPSGSGRTVCNMVVTDGKYVLVSGSK